MSLWSYWTSSDLQEAIETLQPGLLDRLGRILPALSTEHLTPTAVYLKPNLIKIFEAFASSESFRDRTFLSGCLNRLPEEELYSLAARYGVGKSDFQNVMSALLARGWTEAYARPFLEHFGLPDHFLPRPAPRLPSAEDILAPSKARPTTIDAPYKTLKDFQVQVSLDCCERLSAPLARFIVQMPTGSGKTRTAMELVVEHFNGESSANKVVWLVHSEELCEQAFQCFREIATHALKRDVRAHRAWGKHTLPDSMDGPQFIVGGFPKLHALLKKDPGGFAILAPRVGLTFIDEAHKTTAPTYLEVTKALVGPHTQVVGLSATPGRSDLDETEELADFFFGSKVGLKVGEGQTVVSMLRERGVLSEAKSNPLYTEIDYELSPKELRYLEKNFDYPPGFLSRLAADEIRNVEILRRLIRALDSGRKVLFFGCSVEHSRFIAALLIYFGHAAAHIDGKTSKAARVAAIDDFKAGHVRVLCNYGILSTGFDAPKTDVVFISRPTQSVVLYSQMIGRGLRGPAIGGTEECVIIDVRDNILGFGDQDRVYDYFEDYWY